ncbi:MAG: type II secretion system F family protein [Deltaproteobacteria bacterium]
MKILALSLCFITLILVFYLIAVFVLSKQRYISRLNKYIYDSGRSERYQRNNRKFKNSIYFLSKTIRYIKFLDGYRNKIQADLVKANIPLKSEEFINIRIILSLGLGIVPYISGKGIVIAVISGILGWIIPYMYVNTRIKKRIKQFNDSLGDAIVLIANSLKAGFSFFQAVDVVAKEMDGPIAQEFGIMQKEINLGCTTEEALENLNNRIKSNDLELLITAVMIQRQVGGNLAEVLDNISTTIRERIKIKGEIKTITAQGRMSGMVIAILPPALGFIIYLINPEHIGLLFKSTLGFVLVGVSIGMEVLGIYFIKKIVDIEI